MIRAKRAPLREGAERKGRSRSHNSSRETESFLFFLTSSHQLPTNYTFAANAERKSITSNKVTMQSTREM
jgi:hypothetical protein